MRIAVVTFCALVLGMPDAVLAAATAQGCELVPRLGIHQGMAGRICNPTLRKPLPRFCNFEPLGALNIRGRGGCSGAGIASAFVRVLHRSFLAGNEHDGIKTRAVNGGNTAREGTETARRTGGTPRGNRSYNTDMVAPPKARRRYTGTGAERFH
jgi:hypothetical protein